MSIAFSEIYYAMHICITQVKTEEILSSLPFAWNPELSFSRKNFSVFMKLFVPSLPYLQVIVLKSIVIFFFVLYALHMLFLEESKDPLIQHLELRLLFT